MENPRGKTTRIALAVIVIVLTCNSGRSDTVYVWSGDETIKQFTNYGSVSILASNVTGWNGPVGLALDNAGNLYSGCPGNSAITKYASNGTASVVGQTVDSVSGLAFDCRGNLFATIPNYNGICNLQLYFDRYYLNPAYGTQSHLGWCPSLAFDGSGDIYVANSVWPFPFGHGGSYTSGGCKKRFDVSI